MRVNTFAYYSSVVSESTSHTKIVCIGLSASIPVIKVVAALILISSLPWDQLVRLMRNHDTLLEFGIVILACVPSILRNLESIQFLNTVLFGIKLVRWSYKNKLVITNYKKERCFLFLLSFTYSWHHNRKKTFLFNYLYQSSYSIN